MWIIKNVQIVYDDRETSVQKLSCTDVKLYIGLLHRCCQSVLIIEMYNNMMIIKRPLSYVCVLCTEFTFFFLSTFHNFSVCVTVCCSNNIFFIGWTLPSLSLRFVFIRNRNMTPPHPSICYRFIDEFQIYTLRVRLGELKTVAIPLENSILHAA